MAGEIIDRSPRQNPFEFKLITVQTRSLTIQQRENQQKEGKQMSKATMTPELIRGTPNRDPITGTPGAHPVGTGVGAAGGAAAGAAIGALGGPVGAVIGGVAGAIAGGLAGKGVAEKIDPTVEDGYWKDNYSKRSYADKNVSYDHYRPAYRVGYEGYARYPGKKYEDVESDLRRDYEKSRGNSKLAWDRAEPATRDAWERVESAGSRDPGDDGL